MSPDNDQTEPATLTDGRKPKHTKLWLLLILLLGLGLRVAGLTGGQAFCYGSQDDCLDAYRVAANYAQGEPRAQYIGQPNFNEHSKLPGPLWAMFCAAGLHLWGSIDGVVWAIILLNTAAIYLTYLLAARTVGFPAALWAALLMATSPGAIEFSVVVFNPVVMSFLGAGLFLALWQVVQRNRSRAAFWLLFLPLMMLQFHMSGLMLIPAIILVLWLKPARLNFPWLVGGIVAGLALYLPYVFGEMAHGWENTRGMMSGGHRGYSMEALKIFSAPPGFLVNYGCPRWTSRPSGGEQGCPAWFLAVAARDFRPVTRNGFLDDHFCRAADDGFGGREAFSRPLLHCVACPVVLPGGGGCRSLAVPASYPADFPVPAFGNTWRQCLACFDGIPVSGKVHRTRGAISPKLSQSRNRLPNPESSCR